MIQVYERTTLALHRTATALARLPRGELLNVSCQETQD